MKAYRKTQILILVSISVVAAAGCATGPRLGSVTKVVSEKEAEIYVGKTKTGVGDRVVFYAEECTTGIGRSARRTCTKSRRG